MMLPKIIKTLRRDIDAIKASVGNSNPNIWLAQRGASLANDATETAVFAKSLEGGTLSTNNGLLIEHVISYLNNSGVNRDFSLRFKWGGTTIFTDTNTFSTAASARVFRYQIYLTGNGATNSQIISVARRVGGSSLLTAVSWATAEYTAAIDSTADQTVSITWKHSAAAATITADERLTIAHFIGAVS